MISMKSVLISVQPILSNFAIRKWTNACAAPLFFTEAADAHFAVCGSRSCGISAAFASDLRFFQRIAERPSRSVVDGHLLSFRLCLCDRRLSGDANAPQPPRCQGGGGKARI